MSTFKNYGAISPDEVESLNQSIMAIRQKLPPIAGLRVSDRLRMPKFPARMHKFATETLGLSKSNPQLQTPFFTVEEQENNLKFYNQMVDLNNQLTT